MIFFMVMCLLHCAEIKLSDHQSSVNSNVIKPKDYICPFDDCDFPSTEIFAPLRQHITITHNDTMQRECYDVPVEEHERYSIFIKNTPNHLFNGLRQCKGCQKFFFDVNHTKNYKKLVKKVQCTQCEKLFFNAISLKKHCNLVHPEISKTFLCAECGDCFSSARTLKKHQNNEHPITKKRKIEK